MLQAATWSAQPTETGNSSGVVSLAVQGHPAAVGVGAIGVSLDEGSWYVGQRITGKSRAMRKITAVNMNGLRARSPYTWLKERHRGCLFFSRPANVLSSRAHVLTAVLFLFLLTDEFHQIKKESWSHAWHRPLFPRRFRSLFSALISGQS